MTDEVTTVKAEGAPDGPSGAEGAMGAGGSDVAEVEMKHKVRPINFPTWVGR